MDYLLRDSLHLGVQYGRYDLDRLVETARAVEMRPEGSGSVECRLAVAKGGWHAAVGLISGPVLHVHPGLFSQDAGRIRHSPPAGAGAHVAGQCFSGARRRRARRIPQVGRLGVFWAALRTATAESMGDAYATGAIFVRYGNRPRVRWLMHRRISTRRVLCSETCWSRRSGPRSPGTRPAIRTSWSPRRIPARWRPLSDYSPVIKQLKEAPHRQIRLYLAA